MPPIQESVKIGPRTYLHYFLKEISMKRKFALLIDGAFLKIRLKESIKSDITAQIVGDFIEKIQKYEILSELLLYRAFYHDAEPFDGAREKPLNGGLTRFDDNSTVRANKDLIKQLQNFPFVAVRLGKTEFRGWQLKPKILEAKGDSINISAQDLSPSIQQKGVDMRIGLDIAAITLKKFADVIVLVSGDSDFVPVLKFARTEGCQVFLFTLGKPIKEELRAHADVCVELTVADIIPDIINDGI